MDIRTIDKQNEKVSLGDISPEPPDGADKDEAKQKLESLGEELFDLQDLMWGSRMNAVLIVLQGRDTAGKDGTIKRVAGFLNPRGLSTTSFGVPTTEELEHDFHWRVHRATPRKGEFAIFNRSHYEDVLVTRVRELVPEVLWKERYGHIRDFEELLAEHGTIILKFFLHIDLEEQEKRLISREKEPRKAWKVNPGDWEDRELWDGYTQAYEEVFARTSTKHAPWTIVPANSKWYRNLVVAKTIVEALRPHRDTWQQRLDDVGKSKKKELSAWRKRK